MCRAERIVWFTVTQILSADGQTALLVVDVQKDVVADAWHRAEIVGRIVELVRGARDAGVPVVWVRHGDEDLLAGTDGWQIVPELVPAPGEAVVDKHHGDSFEDTDLGDILAELGIRHVVVCGLQSDGCVLATLFGGFVRGYDMTLVGDAHTTNDRAKFGVHAPVADIIAMVNFIWERRTAPQRKAAVTTTQSITW